MIEIQAATHKDVEDIVERGELFWSEHYYSEYGDYSAVSTRNALHAMVDGEQTVVIVARDEGRLIGYIALIVAYPPWGNVSSAAESLWWVDKDYRNQGVGKDLLAAGLEWAAIMNCQLLEAHDHRGQRMHICVGK